MSRFRISLLVLAGAALAACASNGNPPAGDGGSGGSSGGSGGAAVTAVGAPIAGLPVAQASIDASGGTLDSPDGQLTLTVPAGALSASTNITITAIQNTAPNGVGYAYRFGPDGTTFSQPVTLTFHPTYGQLDEATQSRDNVTLAYQDGQGRWVELSDLTANADGSVAATTTHFTDYAYLLNLELVAEVQALLGGQSTNVSVSSVPALPIGDGLYAGVPVEVSLTGNPTWTLNGSPGVSGPDGELDPLANEATYTAPSQKPPHDPETVSVTYTASGGQQVTLLSEIYILAHKYDLNVTLSEEADQCDMPVVAYTSKSVESADIELDLANDLSATSNNPGPGGAPQVTNTTCCVSGGGESCTAAFDSSDEPVALVLDTGTHGAWDDGFHRLSVVPTGQAWIHPALTITITPPVGSPSSSVVDDDGLSAWNQPGYSLLVDAVSGVATTETNVTPGYIGKITVGLTPTQF